ncbi:transaldolase [Marinobacterium arenosum]|uniref:transaldolase n=1 Tax=Marinobacterium arenosum TaxID=2862496 RepID=UPI001C9730BB|nr:transaldolase [Marinobacterium arenosum]MBY4677897.1 transaldolase [Marinobacterium arenosum]
MMNQLEQLKQMTVVVADTGDIDAIRQFTPEDATTNPSLLLKAAALDEYRPLLGRAKQWALAQNNGGDTLLHDMTDAFAVLIGCQILQLIPGRISTEVDARLSFDCEATLARARKLIRLYEENGIGRERVLVKIASTWEGIQAARELEREGINCNLTLLFSQTQAAACADAGAYLISPFVGRILDWYKAQQPEQDFSGAADPGVRSVSAIYRYFKTHGYNTIVMGASFRNTDEILSLAGCDRLTIAPPLMEQLAASNAPLSRQLGGEQRSEDSRHEPSEHEFRWLMNEDAMATEKLAEGIRKFAADQVLLEQLLSQHD